MTTALSTRVNTNATYAPSVNGAPLSSSQIDNNFISLAVNKLEVGNNLSDVASTSTARTNLGLGSIATQNSNNVSITGGSISGVSITSLTAALPIASGGTGLTTTPSNGQLLVGNGTNYTLTNLGGTVNQVYVTNTSGSITLSGPQDLAASSNVQHGSLGIGTPASGTAGEIRAANQITSFYSDERLKENITIISEALDKVMQLSGVTYNGNKIAESFGFTNKEKQVGVLAADVEKVLPEAVKPAPFDIKTLENGNEISASGENYKTVQYEKLVPLLIEAIKELNREISLLKK